MRSCIFILLLLLTSCGKDWLDVKSDAKLTVPSTLSDFQGLLDDVQYINTFTSDKGEISSDGHYVTATVFNNAAVTELKDAYIWSKTIRHTSEQTKPWALNYRKILYCNTVLDGLEKYAIKNSSEVKTRDDIKGQALFHRALTFFQLSQLYVPPTTKQNENLELGLILRISSDITIAAKRSTIKATYDQIIKDLETAIEILNTRPDVLTRGSKISAWALLARVHLYLGNYEKSLKYANNSISAHPDLLDYNTLVPYKGNMGVYNSEVIYHETMTTSVYTVNSCLMDTNLISSYDNNDLRKSLYFKRNSNGTYAFQGNYFNRPSPLFCGFANDEMYLTRAESNARLGNYTEAMNDLNNLLKKRWKESVDYIPIEASNAEEALSIIITERKKSLILRGIRWMDLRRLNLDDKFKTTLTRDIAGTIYTLEPNSYKYAFPLPDDIIEQTGVAQNPGWTK